MFRFFMKQQSLPVYYPLHDSSIPFYLWTQLSSNLGPIQQTPVCTSVLTLKLPREIHLYL